MILLVGLAIPFFVGFGVLFANGQSDWNDNGRGILLPGDLFMWFGLIFLDFAFIFATFYYRLMVSYNSFIEVILKQSHCRSERENQSEAVAQASI